MNSDRASVVDRACPRIAGKVSQTLRKPALQFHAQRVVVRLAAAIDLLEPAKLRIGSPGGFGSQTGPPSAKPYWFHLRGSLWRSPAKAYCRASSLSLRRNSNTVP